MNLKLALVALATFSLQSQAAPFIETASWPATAIQPTSVTVQAGSYGPTECVLIAGQNGTYARCDLEHLPTGVYSVVLRASNFSECTNAPDGSGAICRVGGAASSNAFQLELRREVVEILGVRASNVVGVQR